MEVKDYSDFDEITKTFVYREQIKTGKCFKVFIEELMAEKDYIKRSLGYLLLGQQAYAERELEKCLDFVETGLKCLMDEAISDKALPLKCLLVRAHLLLLNAQTYEKLARK